MQPKTWLMISANTSQLQPLSCSGSAQWAESPPLPSLDSHAIRIMLETIAILLIVLWLLGMVTSVSLGGLIHLLLVIAVVAILLRLIRGRGL